MSTVDFITALFCSVDEHLPTTPKHVHAKLHPREKWDARVAVRAQGCRPPRV